MTVRCNDCMWTGDEEDLTLDYSTAVDGGAATEHCPNCGRDDCLMDLEEQET